MSLIDCFLLLGVNLGVKLVVEIFCTGVFKKDVDAELLTGSPVMILNPDFV